MALRINPGAALFLCQLAIAGGFFLYLLTGQDTFQPLHLVTARDFPDFTDDLTRTSLLEGTRRQMAYLKRQDPPKIIGFGSDEYDTGWLLHSVEAFLEKLERGVDNKELRRFLIDHYLVYQAGGRRDRHDRQMLVTGYYEPVFEGSLTRQPPFLTPIYSLPDSLVAISQASGENRIGRYTSDNRLINYWSRSEIETQDLIRGNELAFLKDPFEAFLLHVQGSGKILLPDGSLRSVRYAGSNGLEYKSIGKLLVDEKIMTLDEVNIPTIRAYLKQHPEKQQRILHHNPRFIFFAWGDTIGPRGSYGEVLTPGRSIAIDPSALPGGTLGYLVSRTPKLRADGQQDGWQPLARFVYPQDSGAAIKGPGRVDIFFGQGHAAEFAANHMKEDGKLYFLVKKRVPETSR